MFVTDKGCNSVINSIETDELLLMEMYVQYVKNTKNPDENIANDIIHKLRKLYQEKNVILSA